MNTRKITSISYEDKRDSGEMNDMPRAATLEMTYAVIFSLSIGIYNFFPTARAAFIGNITKGESFHFETPHQVSCRSINNITSYFCFSSFDQDSIYIRK